MGPISLGRLETYHYRHTPAHMQRRLFYPSCSSVVKTVVGASLQQWGPISRPNATADDFDKRR